MEMEEKEEKPNLPLYNTTVVWYFPTGHSTNFIKYLSISAGLHTGPSAAISFLQESD